MSKETHSASICAPPSSAWSSTATQSSTRPGIGTAQPAAASNSIRSRRGSIAAERGRLTDVMIPEMNGCDRAASFDDTDRCLRWCAANARPLAGMRPRLSPVKHGPGEVAPSTAAAATGPGSGRAVPAACASSGGSPNREGSD